VFYADVVPNEEERAKHVTDAIKPALATLIEKFAVTPWDKASIAAAFKEVLAQHSLKMPQLAMPVRVLAVGTAHTPSVDAVLELISREILLARLKNA
jgi:glutamyl-tRNA synthetase